MADVPDQIVGDIAALFNKSVETFLSSFELVRLNKLINSVLDADPALTYSLKSAYEILAGSDEKAGHYIDNAIALNSTNCAVFLNCGISLLKLGQSDRAGDILEQAFCMHPRLSILVEMLRLAYCYDNRNKLALWGDMYFNATNSIFNLYFNVIKFGRNKKIHCQVKNSGKIVHDRAFLVTIEDDQGKYLAKSETFPMLISLGQSSEQALNLFCRAVEEMCGQRPRATVSVNMRPHEYSRTALK